MSTRLQDLMRVKERLQCDTSGMSFTSAVLLNDEGERKNIKVRNRNDFFALFEELVELRSPLL